VSTPSRSSHRFLSVLPFNLQFHGHPHLINVTLFSSALPPYALDHWARRRRPSPSLEARAPAWWSRCLPEPRDVDLHPKPRLSIAWRPRSVPRQEPELQDADHRPPPPAEIQPPPPVSTVGGHTSKIPSLSSTRFAPQPSLGRPHCRRLRTARRFVRSCPP
jgi:hypothetical protein